MLHAAGRAAGWISSWVQRRRDRFLGKYRYWVEQAQPPEDYIYENLSVPRVSRYIRMVGLVLLEQPVLQRPSSHRNCWAGTCNLASQPRLACSNTHAAGRLLCLDQKQHLHTTLQCPVGLQFFSKGRQRRSG